MRESQKKQKACLLWFTGLSGSGKSTIANAMDEWLFEKNYHSYTLDGDNVRHYLNKDLGFSDKDRKENIRRIGEVSRLMVDAGLIVLSAFISPFGSDRKDIRKMITEGEFIEIHIKASLSTCEKRDPKGLYKKARLGQIKNFTGIDSIYEEPENPELVINTDKLSTEESVLKIVHFLEKNKILNKNTV